MKYNAYTVSISTEPIYYGSECTTDDAGRIVEQIAAMIEAQFPGITTVEHHDGEGSGKTTGPDESIVEEINLWIEWARIFTSSPLIRFALSRARVRCGSRRVRLTSTDPAASGKLKDTK